MLIFVLDEADGEEKCLLFCTRRGRTRPIGRVAVLLSRPSLDLRHVGPGPSVSSPAACLVLDVGCCSTFSSSPTLLFSSPPSSPHSPHRLQGLCRVASRGALVVLWYTPHLVSGAPLPTLPLQALYQGWESDGMRSHDSRGLQHVGWSWGGTGTGCR